MDKGKIIQKVSDYLDQKFIRKEGEAISNTNRSYCSSLRIFLYHKDHTHFSHLKDISDEVVLKYLIAIPGHSNRCIHHTVIKLMFRVHGFPNKLRYIPYPEKEEKLPVHVNNEEFLKIINVCKNNKHRAIISLMFDAGLRVSEVINLKLIDLDQSNMLINIIQGKGRKDRKIKLSKFLLAILNDYRLEYNPIIYLFNGQNNVVQYSVKSCQEVVKQLTKKAGISKHFTPHKFRHGFAMNLLENGQDLSKIQNQMGHHSIKTTEIYARINNKVIQDIESPLEQIMRENVGETNKKLLVIETKKKVIDTMHNIALSDGIRDIKEKIFNNSSDKTYQIFFKGKTYFLKEKNHKIYEAQEGVRWSIGVESWKAISWFKKKGAIIS